MCVCVEQNQRDTTENTQMHRSNWTPRYQLRQRSTLLPKSLFKNIQRPHVTVREVVLYKNKASTMIDQYIYCTDTYIDIWQQPVILKFLNVEMKSAPEHTADEDGKHPKAQRLYESLSVFTLFKQLICNRTLFDRPKCFSRRTTSSFFPSRSHISI